MRGLVHAALVGAAVPTSLAAQETGNVVFFHPDGTSVNAWGAARMVKVGSDGELYWDRLPGLGVYKGHMADRLTGTSHGGVTGHAYGSKAVADSFGLNGDQPITAASDQDMSIAIEAMAAGEAEGLIQTGHIAEPGTAAFVAANESRCNTQEIAAAVIRSGAQGIMAGGERSLLQVGTAGRHGEGQREDGLNLIERADALGDTVVYTSDERIALDPASVDMVLGVFAHNHTCNGQERERNLTEGLPTYVETAPTIAEMSEVGLAILSRAESDFFAVIEDERADNIANNMNAAGALKALVRADDAMGVIHELVQANPDTLMIMAADS